MVQTYEQKVELLKKARLAKQAKQGKKQPEPEPIPEPIPETVPEPIPEPIVEKVKRVRKAKPKVVKEPERTLVIEPDEVLSEEEIIEERIEIVKVKKPKKLIKKVIQQVYETDSDEEILEEVVVKPTPRERKSSTAERKQSKAPAKPFEILQEKYNFNF